MTRFRSVWVFVLLASVSTAFAQQSTAFQEEAGRMLLSEGIVGLQAALNNAGVPALTFNQESQVRTVYDAHVRARQTLVAGNGGSLEGLAAAIEDIEGQLLLAALKFLNPAQRTALIGAAANADFTATNTDLPEDEGELREYLTDLVSPAGTENTSSGNNSFGGGGGGGGGGGLIIDGFSGGRMPNREEIQEIRINENSFTAEQSSQTRGRTEVITRGGIGRFNGDFTFDFADESLDARNAFASSRPPYQQRDFSGNISGPVIRDRLTLTFSATNNTSESGQTIRALTPDGLVTDAIVRPSWQKDYTTRATLQLSQNHNLSGSLNWSDQRGENQNVGNFGLPEQGGTSGRDGFTYQIKETAVLSGQWNNEVRFQVNGFMQQQKPVTDAPFIDVLGAFRAGGSPNNRDTKVRQYDFGDLLMYTGNRIALRMGFDGGFNRINSDSRNDFNGTFTFSSLYDYCGIVLGGYTRSQCAIERAAKVASGADLTPQSPTYSISLGDPTLEVNQWQPAVFVQSDYRVRPDLTLYFGARYEWQSNLDDGNNIDPRFGFAYQLGSNTVLRGGTGVFHQRLQFFAVTDIRRFDGTNQRSLEITAASYPDPFLSSGGVQEIPPSSIRVMAPEIAAPYTWNSEVSVETSTASGLIVTGSYRFIRGIHLMRDRNLNAPYDSTAAVIQSCYRDQNDLAPGTCVRPDPTSGNINQLESTGTSSSHVLRFGARQRLSFLNLNMNYTYDSTYDDVPEGGGGGGGGGGNNNNSPRLAADNYDLDSEWGRSGARHGVSASGNVRLPWDINANTIFDWNTGSPYTHETGRDDNLDTTRNDRPPDVPRNSLTGPGFFEVGLNFSKAIQLRSDQVEGAAAGPVGSDGYYGQRTGVRMTLSADVTNLLNNVNFQSFSGVETSSFFMRPTRAREPRKIVLSARFAF